MRLIDADLFEVVSTNKSLEFAEGMKHILEMIDSAPTVDAVEVVRCENCKYKGENIDTSGTVVVCDLRDESPVAVLYNDYCSYGTRKDGAENDR